MARYDFPKDFIWGVAASSYQIEGAWNEDGKGESIWDRRVHIPGSIKDGTTADRTIDFYHKYNEDIDMLADLNIQSFLYTISWPRVLPKGVGEVNQAGVDFYKNVFKKCKEKGIRLMVVLYHWDLPQALQDRGGWANREILGWFEEYAALCYREFGEYVDEWITFVEPRSILMGFEGTGQAPYHDDPSELFLCGHHINLCHGLAVKMFRESGLKSRIGIKQIISPSIPYDPNSEADIAAAKLYDQYENSYYMDPILKGEYPKELFEHLEKVGVRLPEIQPGDMELMNQPLDFFGLNSYRNNYIKAGGKWPLGVTPCDVRFDDLQKRMTPYNWEFDENSFYNAIRYVTDRYDLKDIIITETGCASPDWKDEYGRVNDVNRQIYLRSNLRQVHRAIEEGAPITGYHIWSCFDNFEWLEGLNLRFGLIYVDYVTLERTPKVSAYWYSDIIKKNYFEDEL